MKRLCLLLSLSLIAATNQEKSVSPKEAFFLRRISEFWKDKDYALVKKQVIDFLAANPQTPVKDNLYAILGDLYFQEENLSEALAAYQEIEGPEFQEKTLAKHIFCLHQKEDWEGIATLAYPYAENGSEEVRFLLAEALYKELAATEDLDRKIELAEKAKPILQSLISDKYKEFTLLPLAEVHRFLKEYPQSASLYLILAEKDPEQAQELLFQAATLELEYDRNEAVKTFLRAIEKPGSKSALSAFNVLVLLYQDENYTALTKEEAVLAKNLDQDKLPLFHFCLGRSFFLLENWQKASSHLEQFLEEPAESPDYQKSAFLTLLTTAQRSNDMALFDRALKKLMATFPEDPETAKALLLHAQISLQKDDLAQASSDLEQILTQFPEFGEQESLAYDHALLLSQGKNWGASRKAFLGYLQQFPSSLHAETIWGYILNCSIQELKSAGPQELNMKKEQFATDLKACLDYETVFSSDEKPDYHFLLGKTLYEIGQTQEAIDELSAHLLTYDGHPTIAEAHLLLALCYLDSSPTAFTQHAETALALNPTISDRGILHLHLFNTYLAMKDYDKAAEHLFDSYIVEKHPIQRENQLWLANYYYSQAKNKDAVARDRAITLFQKLFGIQDEQMSFEIAENEAFLEVEAMKFGDLLQGKEKAHFFSALAKVQDQHPEYGWKFQRQALFELGKAYETMGDADNALAAFERLIHTSSFSPSYFSTAAQLERTRILYRKCPECDRQEGSDTMTEILSNLKDLQIQKKLISEPIHLEAALDYADIRSLFSNNESQLEASLFFLNRVKEDFTSQDDLAAKEYHDLRARLPEKEHLFQSYMKCIEAEMLRLEAAIAKKQSNPEKAKNNEGAALALLEELMTEKNLTSYLKNRIEVNLKALTK